jgi:diguanylate cyclase (GGDEF)-like protein
MEEIASDWLKQDQTMSNFSQRIAGFLLALGILALALLPGPGVFFVCVPVFFMVFLRFELPIVAQWFICFYLPGMAAGKMIFQHYQQNWVFPEAAAFLCLFFASSVIKEAHGRTKKKFDHHYDSLKKEFENFRSAAEKLRKENIQIEKQLRQIEHLYDVIKEAGSTLNVQEMIELTKEFTERMFDLQHFIIAVLSNDGKKYEIRVASGCDQSFFRSFEIDPESDQLSAVLARERKPVWAASIGEQDHFSKLKNLSVQSFVFLPFLVQDRVIGFLSSFSTSDKFIDQEEFSNFQVFCNQISIGLQKSLLYEKVQKLSITDGLTKLYSHRYFKQRLEEELVLANRYSSPLSLLILDIDHFKHYNDNYGHVAGDHVLMEVSKILKEQSDMTHLAARYGGEEMVLIAPETTKEQAMELAEKIRKSVEFNPFAVGKETTKVTVSIGVATFPQDAQTNLDLISKADKALYAAKNRGRNRIVAYPL